MMRAGPVGLAIVLIAGLAYFAWLVMEPERRADASEAPTKLEIASRHPSAQTPAAVSPVSTSPQSELTNRLHATYLRQQCRDHPRNRLTDAQFQLLCRQNYSALFDELLPMAEAGDLNSLGQLLAIAVGCQIRQSIPKRDLNQEVARLHQIIQKKAGVVPDDIANALPTQIALVNGESAREACVSIEQHSAYVLALADAREHELQSMEALPSPLDTFLKLNEAANGKRSMSADEFAKLRAQLPDHQRHALAMSVIRCKLGQCALPIADDEARQWLLNAVEHGDWEALTYWRGQLAQEPARAMEAYAWNLFSRDLLHAGCYPTWFAAEAAYNFGELEQLGQQLSITAQAEAQQLASNLITQLGQQARRNLACD